VWCRNARSAAPDRPRTVNSSSQLGIPLLN
jgi:hypothetical protein